MLRTLLAAILVAVPLEAQEAGKVPVPDKTDAALARAVAFLVGTQAADGSIVQAGQNQNQTAMTSLAILAMAAVGHQPTDDTREGKAMKKALAFVLKPERQNPQGYLGEKDGSRMYGHGIVTLMLAEMLGMGVDAQQDQALRDRCRKAVDLILKSQALKKDARGAGGWRYQPESMDSDLSVTVWQVMALRSARNAGLDVPKESIERALEYIKRCYYVSKEKEGDRLKSGCGYEPGRRPEYAMAAAGLLSLAVCGDYESAEVKGSAEWLKEQKPDFTREWFFYGTYYYAQGMFQRGGEHAAHARKTVEEILLPKQGADGAWTAQHPQERDAGKVYSTSLGILCLAVKFHFLPIYQR